MFGVEPLFGRQLKLCAHLGITRRVNRCLPERARILLRHPRDVALAVVERTANALDLCRCVPAVRKILSPITFDFVVLGPGIVKDLTRLGVKTRSHKTIDDKSGRSRHAMGFLKQLGLLAHVFLNHMRVANGVLIHSGVAHLNKQPQAACQIGIMRMMEIIGFAAFDQASCLTKVVRHARLNGNDLRPLIGITCLKQRLRHLDHLARLHELTRDKALHSVLVYGRTQQVAILFIANELRLVQLLPRFAHLPANALINQKLVGLVLIFLAIHQRLVFETVVLNVGTRNDMVDLILARARHKFIEIDSAAGIQAFSVLHQIEGQALVKVHISCLELLEIVHNSQVAALGLKRLERVLDDVPALRGPLALLLFVLVASHLNKNVSRRVPRNLCDFVNNANRLIQAATNRRGSGKLIYA